MRTLLESETFQDELPGWALRGVLCALNSAFWAGVMGFQDPAEIAGMAAGVAFWVGAFAGLCAWAPGPMGRKLPQLAAALKRAAWIKIGLTAAGWLLLAGASALNMEGAEVMGMFGMIDTLLGMSALWVVSQVGSFPDIIQIPQVDSFGWTTLTTIVEGALMAALIGFIALAMLAWWRVQAEFVRQQGLISIRPPGPGVVGRL